MAKQTDKRRVFFVQLHIEEFTDAVAELLTQEEQAMFLLGMQRGCRGQGRHDAAEKQSDAFRNGYDYGLAMYEEAETQYERSRENGRRSAAARAQRHGSAQPKKPKKTAETPSTDSRRGPLDTLEDSPKVGGRGPIHPPGARFPSYRASVETPSTDSRNPLDNGSSASSKGSTSTLRASRTQDLEPSSQEREGGLNMNLSPKRACAHAKDEQQEGGFPEDSDDYVGDDEEALDFQSRRRPILFPGRGYRPGMQTEASA